MMTTIHSQVPENQLIQCMPAACSSGIMPIRVATGTAPEKNAMPTIVVMITTAP